MVTLRPLAAFLVFSSLLAGCAAKSPDPFAMPRSSFDAIRTIAIGEVGVPSGLTDPEGVRSRLSALLAEELTAMGFTVIPTEEVNRVARAIRDAAGPLFDPATGRPDSVRLAAMGEQFSAAVRDSLGANAFLDPDVVVRPAPFVSGKARWDGATQEVQSFGSTLLMAMGGVRKEGVVSALSLRVNILDRPGGQLLYQSFGGLEVLANHRLQPVPYSELFQDQGRAPHAVRVAIAPLRDRHGN
jgi:hypothetical protein